LCGGEDREQQCSRRLASIARGGHNAERAATDPAAASFITEGRTPAAAPHDLASRTAAVCNRASPDDQQDPRAIVESIVHRDQSVGVDDDFFGELHRIECSLKCATLLVATRAGDTAVKDPRNHSAWLGDFGQRLSDEASNHTR